MMMRFSTFGLMMVLLLSNFISFTQSKTVFSAIPSSITGITFQNKLIESPAQNIVTYEYFYNGGGVAAGDFNNDGLIDLYFTSNQQPNALYLNKGNFKFDDITKSAGVAGKQGWKTGVSVADVNGDGFLDIYVCYSGDLPKQQLANQLFINNGNLTFTEKAAAMGVADEGYSTHSVFFDFDKDNDLDLFVINHNIKNLRNFDASYVKKMVDPDAGDRLYENKNGIFEDVTVKAGIISNPLGYGLGVSVADVNNDGWPDLYVTNDYVEEDYLYINNKNGTFKESLKSAFGHISNFSMGIDIADINNDGLNDILTLDMLPEDNKRQKLLYAPDNYELYNNTVNNGFYHQLMRNMLQLNNGDGTFSEIGQLAGISSTDWSWSALLTDFNNDGKKDLFVSNGYGRDMTNRDFVKFYANERLKHLQGKTDKRMFDMLTGIQSTPLHNYLFENQGNLKFKDQSTNWGFDELNFSHGAVYADLDNDGDLDIVVNKMNQEAGIYKNNTIENKTNGNYIDVSLKSDSKNTLALGAKLTLFAASGQYTLENYPVHGFQSSMQIPLHLTFPDKKIDSLTINWPNGNVETIKQDLVINTKIKLTETNKSNFPTAVVDAAKKYFQISPATFNYQHIDQDANDFKIQPLMPNMISYAGPKMAKADVNGDGLEDIYICGTLSKMGGIYLQQNDGNFKPAGDAVLNQQTLAEERNAVFFDADGDGDKDLYIVCGSYQNQLNDNNLQDKLYINNQGNFKLNGTGLPKENTVGSVVLPLDIDSDGDMDLFVGGRVVPGAYPISPTSTLLINDGKGNFSNKTSTVAAIFSTLGMVTDAKWEDINGDNRKELFVTGEWMDTKVFSFSNNKLIDITKTIFNETLVGWWNTLSFADVDHDGDLDLIAGNWGLNSQYHASSTEPLTLLYGDFDNNGFVDPIICNYIQGKSYPMASRDEMTDQIVSLRQFFPTYDAYSEATIDDLLNETQKKTAKKLAVNCLQTVWFENIGGKMIKHELPVEANFAPVHAIVVEDFNHDGNLDILIGGNVEQTRIKIGKIDANYGMLMLGNGKGNFTTINQEKAGICIKGCIRSMVPYKDKSGKTQLLIGINNALPQIYSY